MTFLEFTFATGASVFAMLITIIGFFITRTLNKIEQDIAVMSQNTSELKSFASRVDTVLAYHDREITEIYRMLEHDRKSSNV